MVAKGNRSRVTQHVFATLTYDRKIPLVQCWKQCAKDFNRFVQTQRRLHRDGLEYIRSIEAHTDLYPHIHAVLQHKSGIIVSNNRWFEDELYQKWRKSWTFGISDFQAPRSGSIYPTLYIVKYITKNATLKTLWKKFYSTESGKNPHTSVNGAVATTSLMNTSHDTDSKSLLGSLEPSNFFCKQFKIKQVTWSRSYKFPTKQPKSLIVSQSPLFSARSQEPCPNRA